MHKALTQIASALAFGFHDKQIEVVHHMKMHSTTSRYLACAMWVCMCLTFFGLLWRADWCSFSPFCVDTCSTPCRMMVCANMRPMTTTLMVCVISITTQLIFLALMTCRLMNVGIHVRGRMCLGGHALLLQLLPHLWLHLWHRSPTLNPALVLQQQHHKQLFLLLSPPIPLLQHSRYRFPTCLQVSLTCISSRIG